MLHGAKDGALGNPIRGRYLWCLEIGILVLSSEELSGRYFSKVVNLESAKCMAAGKCRGRLQ